MKILIEKGQRFARLTIIKEVKQQVSPKGQKRRRFLCKCDCGKEIKVILLSLRHNNTKSCGCLHTETITKHGLEKHKLVPIYRAMLSRCYNKKNKQYPDYGARGIKVCKEWKNKENHIGLNTFIKWCESNGYKKGLELDRKDNDKGYSPKNCRFVTRSINQSNKRSNVWIKIKNKDIRLIEFYRKYNPNVDYRTVKKRIQDGWEPMKAIGFKHGSIKNG